jgi:hypothetical protein
LTPEVVKAMEEGKKRFNELQTEANACAEEEDRLRVHFQSDDEALREHQARCCWKNSKAKMKMITNACRNLTFFSDNRARIAGLFLMLCIVLFTLKIYLFFWQSSWPTVNLPSPV